jgi:glutathione synthase/RimK-type ligase-like ATP-grasp enzyme
MLPTQPAHQPAQIIFATYAARPDILPDDEHAAAVLRVHGYRVAAAVWDDTNLTPADWATFSAVVVGSTWDYFTKPAAFQAWLTMLERANVIVFNPIPLMRWNADKIYLRELERAGVPIVPTLWVNKDSDTSIDELLSQCDWTELILKPSISAGSYKTARFLRSDLQSSASEYQALLADIVQESSAMLQPLVPEILLTGEYSFIFFKGSDEVVFSHAVLKSAQAGEFRIQEKYGGQTRIVEAPPHLIQQARDVLDAVESIVGEDSANWLYARVDGVERDGQLLLMEVEMIEPSLFFTEADAAEKGAAERFVDIFAEQFADSLTKRFTERLAKRFGK